MLTCNPRDVVFEICSACSHQHASHICKYKISSHAWFLRHVKFTIVQNASQRPILPQVLALTQGAIHLKTMSCHVNDNLTKYGFWDMLQFCPPQTSPKAYTYLKNHRLQTYSFIFEFWDIQCTLMTMAWFLRYAAHVHDNDRTSFWYALRLHCNAKKPNLR